MQTRAVLFDVGDTLVRPRLPFEGLVTEIGRRLQIDVHESMPARLGQHVEAAVLDRGRRGLPFTYPAQRSQAFWLDTYRDYLSRHLNETDAQRVAAALLHELSTPAGYTLHNDVLPTLRELRHGGLRIGIVSNWESWLLALLETLGLAAFVDPVIISGECHIEKPNPDIFVLAVASCGMRPQEIVYVGDRPDHDVDPPAQLGLRPILIDRVGRHQGPAVTEQIESLRCLPALVLPGG